MNRYSEIQNQIKRTREKFVDRLWGKLPKVSLPSLIVDKRSNQLTLDNYGLSLLLALLFIQRNDAIRNKKIPGTMPDNPAAIVKAYRETLMRITGMSKNLITKGIQSLERAGYVKKNAHRVEKAARSRHDEREPYQQFAVSTYTLLNPTTGAALDARSDDGLLYSNGLHYFSIPACLFAKHPKSKPAPYSFDTMTFAEKRIYIVLVWLARQNDASEFDTTGQQLKSLTGLNDRALKIALEGLESRWLVLDTAVDPTIRNLHIVLRNPVTRELLGVSTFDRNPRNNACNWYEEYAEGQSKKANLLMPAELAESLFLQLLKERGETAQREAGGEYKFKCPFHDDSTPSCNFNPSKGCFYCFSGSCHAKGTTQALLKQLSGSSGEATIRLVAEAIGKTIEYVDPDWEAIAIYDYKDKFGILRKQVLRLKDDAEGNRRFSQRRMGKNGWIYSTKGLKPMLFNLDLFDSARTVFVTEGEKDAVTITQLNLSGGEQAGYSVVVGTTSGGADSWNPKLAKDLKGRFSVFILPDDDEAGEQYSRAIQQSLTAEGIDFQVVSFSGTGAKDITEYMASHSVEDLVRLIGVDKVHMPDGSSLPGARSYRFTSEEVITI